MLLYSRKKVRYRRDGYCWKKRKDGKTTREDHMKLKVQGMEVIKQLIYFTLNCNCCIGKLHLNYVVIVLLFNIYYIHLSFRWSLFYMHQFFVTFEFPWKRHQTRSFSIRSILKGRYWKPTSIRLRISFSILFPTELLCICVYWGLEAENLCTESNFPVKLINIHGATAATAFFHARLSPIYLILLAKYCWNEINRYE